MEDYIIEDFETYRKCALQFDDEKFTNDVLKSFKDSKSYKHYVILVPADLDEYYTQEEQNTFTKYGYYQQLLSERYNNRFFIPPDNIDKACDILKDEHMMVEKVRVQGVNVPAIVVSLKGFGNTHFRNDFANQENNQ